MSRLPTRDELLAAVQDPARSFRDATLKQCVPLPGPLGLPLCYSGGFALAFPLRHPTGATYAVRGLVQRAPGLSERYEAYDAFLNRAPADLRPHLLPNWVQPQGILAGGDWRPVVVLPWVEGSTLNTWAQASLGDPARLAAGVAALRGLFRAMTACGFVHGDLQHGNVLLEGRRPVLLDYDTVYPPGAPPLPRGADGHSNFRHPAFPPDAAPALLDRFPMLVILTALGALAASPGLGRRPNRMDDGLLFLAEDLANPTGSGLFRELERIPAAARMAGALAAAAQGPWAAVPDLDTFLRDVRGPVGVPVAAQPRTWWVGLTSIRTRSRATAGPAHPPQTSRPLVPLLSLALLAGGGAGFATAALVRGWPKPAPVAVAPPPLPLPLPPAPVVQAVVDPPPSGDMAPAELVPAGVTVIGAAPEAQAEPAPGPATEPEPVPAPTSAPAPPPAPTPPPPEPPRLLWDLPTAALRARLEPLAREAEAEWARRATDLEAQVRRTDATLANLADVSPDSRFPLRHADGREVLVSQAQLLAAYRQRRAQVRADLENGERPVRRLTELARNPGEDPDARQVALRSLGGLPPGAASRLQHLLAVRHPLP